MTKFRKRGIILRYAETVQFSGTQGGIMREVASIKVSVDYGQVVRLVEFEDIECGPDENLTYEYQPEENATRGVEILIVRFADSEWSPLSKYDEALRLHKRHGLRPANVWEMKALTGRTEVIQIFKREINRQRKLYGGEVAYSTLPEICGLGSKQVRPENDHDAGRPVVPQISYASDEGPQRLTAEGRYSYDGVLFAAIRNA